jgi:hypothetical protein
MRRNREKSHAVKRTNRHLVSVAGVSFNNDDGSSRQTVISHCKPGETLMLIREPDNKFDAGAIKITRRNGQQIGYVPACIARHGDSGGLAHEIDAGVIFRCRIAEITGGGLGMLYGVTIEITDGD